MNAMKIWYFLYIVTLITVACNCTGLNKTLGRSTSKNAEFPGKNWGYYSKSEDTGFDSKKLLQVREKLTSLDTSGLLVVVGGKILLEYGDISETSTVASIRKSILAIMYGKYVANGIIELDLSLKDLGTHDIGGLLPIEQKATIRDLISSRSGVYHPASNLGDDPNKPPRGSKVPGTYFVYNNWDFNVAGAIFEKLVGKDIYTIFKQDLADPIGMEDFLLSRQEKTGHLQVSQYPAYHFQLSTRDMARIGLLMLRKGNWAAKQVVPEEWIRKITSLVTPSREQNPESERKGNGNGYGYMWFVADEKEKRAYFRDFFFAQGLHGQFIAVFPELDMVIAHKTIREKQGDTWHKAVTSKQFREIINLLLAARL